MIVFIILMSLLLLCFISIGYNMFTLYLKSDTPIQKFLIKRKLNKLSEWEVWKFEKEVIKDIIKLLL